MQALPEWRRQNTQQDGSLSEQGSQQWKQNLHKFLVSNGVKMQKTNLKAKGLANKHHVKACDHAWQALGLGFASFVGKNKCVALNSNETCNRYLERCKAKLLVARCAVVSRIRALAPCALKRCGATRDEYGGCRGFWLHGFASLPFFFAHWKIRCCHFPDPLHRLPGDHNNAITSSGLASMKTERIIVSNHKNGPWR